MQEINVQKTSPQFKTQAIQSSSRAAQSSTTSRPQLPISLHDAADAILQIRAEQRRPQIMPIKLPVG